MRFPQVFAVGVLEHVGYLASFPHLFGTMNAFLCGQSDYRELIAAYDRDGDWQSSLGATGLALVSAACHPLFAHLEGSRGDAGRLFALTERCVAKEHRRRWLEIDQEIFAKLRLPVEVAADDAFFGPGGAVLAANQIDLEAKFELVTEVYVGMQTAIASGLDLDAWPRNVRTHVGIGT